MALKHYTTTISPEKTVTAIQSKLARRGCKSISVQYEKGTPIALSFLMETEKGDQPFVLPVNIEAVLAVLARQHKSGEISLPKSKINYEQAARVAWRANELLLDYLFDFMETGQMLLHQLLMQHWQVAPDMPLWKYVEERGFDLPVPGEGLGQKREAVWVDR